MSNSRYLKVIIELEPYSRQHDGELSNRTDKLSVTVITNKHQHNYTELIEHSEFKSVFDSVIDRAKDNIEKLDKKALVNYE